MNDMTKIAIGALATALMAWGAHGPLGKGAAFVQQLQKEADAGLAAKGINGVTVQFPTSPLSRYPLLSGTVTEADRKAADAVVGGLPGVAYLRWADGGKTAEAAIPAANESMNAAMNVAENGAATANAAAPAAAAVPAEVSACQSGVNAAVANRVINFRSGSAYIAPSSLPILDDVAKALMPCTDIAVEIGGHTDTSGSGDINQRLSQERADRVKAALIERGVPAAALTAKGYGSSKPVNANNGLDAANRRIAFTVTKGGA